MVHPRVRGEQTSEKCLIFKEKIDSAKSTV